MAIDYPPTTKVEEALARLEHLKRRKTRRKRITFLIITSLVLMGAWGSGWMWYNQQSSTSRVVESYVTREAINTDEMTSLLLQGKKGVILQTAGSLDTLRSMEDFEAYQRWLETKLATVEPQEVDTMLKPLEVADVEIEGELAIRELLTFTIANYDAEVDYLIDFDNGVTRSMDSVMRYRYPLPGHFELKVWSYRDTDTSLFVKKYFIDSVLVSP